MCTRTISIIKRKGQRWKLFKNYDLLNEIKNDTIIKVFPSGLWSLAPPLSENGEGFGTN